MTRMNPCPIFTVDNGEREVGELLRPPATNQTRRVLQQLRRHGAVSLADFDDPKVGAAFVRKYRQSAFMTNVAHLAARSRGRVSNLGNLIARHAPSLLSEEAPIRRIRRWLVDSKTVGENAFDTIEFWARDIGENAANFRFSRAIADEYESFLSKVRGRNLTRDQLDRLWVGAVEVGQGERLGKGFGANRHTQRMLENEHNKWRKFGNDLGFSNQELDAIVENARNTSRVYDNVLAAAKMFGTTVDRVEGLGYFSRQFTDDYLWRRHKADIRERGFKTVRNERVSLHTDLQKSRATYDFVVEDEVLLAKELGIEVGSVAEADRKAFQRLEKELNEYQEKVNNRPPGRNEPAHQKMLERLRTMEDELETAAERMVRSQGESLDELAAYLMDDRILSERFREKVSPERIDWLVDNGILGKMPMTSTRMFDLLKQRYKLPYEELGELVETNPIRSFERYKENLKRTLGMSQMVNDVHVSGIAAGFATTYENVVADRAKYADWKPLSNILDEYGVETNNQAARSIYLEPYAYSQYESIVRAAVEPGAIGAIANFWKSLTQGWKTSILLTPAFVTKNLLEVVLQSWRSGTDLNKLVTAHDLYRNYLRFGPDVLPDEKVFAGGKYSVRDLFEEAHKTGRVGYRVPLEDMTLESQVAKAKATATVDRMLRLGANPQAKLDPRNLGRFMRYTMATVEANGWWDGLQYLRNGIQQSEMTLFSRLMQPIAYIEDVVTVANLMSTLDNSFWGGVGQYFSAQQRTVFDNIEDALLHNDKYRYRYSDQTSFDKVMKQVIPFWSYMSRSYPGQFRHMFREPSQFVGYWRLYAVLNGDARDDEDFQEAQVPGWLMNTLPIVVKDPEGRPNMWFALSLTNLDPGADMLQRLIETSESVQRGLGRKDLGNYEEQIDSIMKRHEGGPMDWLFEQSHPVVKAAYAALSQEHPFYGSPFSEEGEFAGVEFGSGPWNLSGGYVQYLLETFMPRIRYATNLAGDLSSADDAKGLARAVLEVSGFNIRAIDGMKELGGTQYDLYRSSQEASERARKLRNKAERTESPDERSRLVQEAVGLEVMAEQLEYLSEQADETLKERTGMTGREAYDAGQRYEEEVELLEEQIRGN